MKKLSLFLIVTLIMTIVPFSVYATEHNAYAGMRGIDRDYCSVSATEKGDSLHSMSLGNGAYVLYKNVNFGENGAFRANVKINALLDTSAYMGGNMEMRLDERFGKTIAYFKTDSTVAKEHSYDLDETITGVHDVYLVCMNKAIQISGVSFEEYAENGKEYAMYDEPDYLKDIQNTGKKNLIYTMIELGLIEPFMPDEYNLNIGISRGDYAVTIAKILGYESTLNGTTDFEDVDPSSDYAGAVAYLKQNGVIFGQDNGSFVPDDYITVTEALTMAVRALGYESVVTAQGKGYPLGYLSMADRLKLAKGLVSDNKLTRGDLVTLVNNILNSKYLETIGVSGNTEAKEQIKGILSKTCNIYKGEGLVRANSFTTLAAPVQSFKNGMVRIDDEIFYTGDTYAASLIGYDVNYYYKEENDIKTLLSVSPVDNLNVITADTGLGDEVTMLTETTFSFYDSEADKEKNETIEKSTHILYNGKAIDVSLSKLLESENFKGRVRLVESSEPTLIIEEYISVWAKTVQRGQYKVFDGLTETSMILDPDENDVALFYKGKAVTFSFLNNQSVLMVYQSKNKSGKKLIRVEISNMAKEGTITSVSDEVISIDGEDYIKSMQASQSFKPGIKSRFLLNDNDEIVAYSQSVSTDNMRVGVLTGFDFDTGLNHVVQLQIFEDNNEFGVYNCAEKVTIDGIRIKDANAVLNGNKGFAGLANMQVKNTLIRYRTDDAGEIELIDTFVKSAGGPDDTFTRLTEAGAAFRFNGTSKLFTTKKGDYAIAPYADPPELFGFKKANDNSTLFYGSKLTDYMSASYAWNSESMTGEVYCLDTDRPFVSHVLWQDAGGGTKWGFPFVVSEKSVIMVGDEVAISVRGYRNTGAICNFYIKQEDYNKNEPNMINVRKILEHVQPGDALRMVAADDGEISNCEILFLSNGAETSKGGISVTTNKNNGLGEINSVSRLRATIFGEVTALFDDFAQIKYAPDMYEYVKVTNCMRYNYRKGKPIVENNLTSDELSVGDKVLYLAVDYQPRVLCIYEHPDFE